MFYAEPATKAASPVNIYVTYRERTVCLRRELNQGQPTLTVLVTGTNRIDKLMSYLKGVIAWEHLTV